VTHDRTTTAGHARTQILARIRAARPTATVAVPRDYRPAGAAEGDPVALLVDRLLDYRATVHQCAAPDLPTTLVRLLDQVPRIAVPVGLPAGWLVGYQGTILRCGQPVALTVGALDAPGLAAVTSCAVAIGQTGTLILDGADDQGPRRLTLVPDHHVCVVRTDQVVAGVPEALARIADPKRPLTLISGPSATSDIELRRVEGVHGPRRLEVLIVAPTAPPAG